MITYFYVAVLKFSLSYVLCHFVLQISIYEIMQLSRLFVCNKSHFFVFESNSLKINEHFLRIKALIVIAGPQTSWSSNAVLLSSDD